MMSSSFLKARNINGARGQQESCLLSGQQALQYLKQPRIKFIPSDTWCNAH